jgi:TIR domain
MALDTFISYSSKDKTAADAACAVLERAGVRCWIAPRDIRPGQEYGHAIIEAIDRCRVMVLIFSADANDSRQIHREIERAVSKGVPIIPLRIEEVVPTRSMEYFLGAIHWLDALTPPLEKHLQQLTEAVKALLQIDISGAAAPLRDNSSQVSSQVSFKLRPAEVAMQRGSAAWLIASGRPRILVIGIAAVFIALLIGGVWHYLVREPAAVTASAQALAASLSRTVQSGIKTEVSEHVGFDRSCVPQHVVVKITKPPANGTATTTEENKALPANTELGGVQPCAGKSAPTAVVYYQSKPDFRGTDQFRYQRTNQDNPNDRLNGEILITVTVK